MFKCGIFFLCVCIILVEGFGGLTRVGSFNTLNSTKSGPKKSGESRLIDTKQSTEGGVNKINKAGRNYLSAWGIISIIMLLILGSVFVYYLSIFYPMVCAKRGKYDIMEMTSL